ncbi:MAG: S8 family serine peptidase, partial [Micromonosporaceae bacterium]|nr:S8 family serine peptidase [Micromonosporaceae bacterium]
AEGATDFWIHLREQADLGGAESIADWDQRGQFVYDRLTQTAETSQAGLRELLEAEGVAYKPYWISNTILVTGDADLLTRIADRPEVDEILADRVYQIPKPIAGTPEETIDAIEWNIDRVNAPQVWSDFGVRGEGIVVGSIDTGAQFDHPALVSQYRGNLGNGVFDHNYNWFDPTNHCGTPVPCDTFGHGTHTMGTTLGDDGGDNQIGVAPGATWITANGCPGGGCPQQALLDSFAWLLAPTDLEGNNPDPSMRPHVVNNSWGSNNGSSTTYLDSVRAWVAAGIFPVFSNGNNGAAGCGTVGSPGSYPESYGVGAFDINDNIASFSSRGASPIDGGIKPNVSAPGVNVRSSVPGNGYAPNNGTSMAAPHVTGVVALMWSAADSLVRDLDATRDLLDMTAIDTANDQCGGTPENNNVWGEGRLDAFAAVDQSPRGPVGMLTGTVSDSATGDPISGADVTLTGPVDRELTTGEAGTYSITLPVGDYSATASAFGYGDQTVPVTITEGQTTEQNFPLVAVDSATVRGTITDGSGHGWPIYARVDVDGVPVSTFTDPLTGQYELSLPVNDSYTIQVTSQYPGYDGHTADVDLGESDVTVDVSLLVDELRCREAPGYELDQPRMAMLSTNPGSSFSNYFEDRGVTVDFFTAAQIDQITGYDLVMLGYNFSTVNDQAFLDFLDRTDAEGTGVVFLDHGFTTHNGIRTLSRVTGNPASRGSNTAGTGQETFYQPTQAHPILEGFDIGEQIIVEPGLAAWIAWFDGYTGEGTQVIADVGRTTDGIFGSGIAVQERATNRHALLSMNSQTAGRGPNGWSEDSEQIFWNAVDWAAPGEASFECNPVEGGLVLGQVQDRNTSAGLNGATVTSGGNPDESAVSFATPDDPGLDDGFYWLFSSLIGDQQFTASAGNYVDDAQTVSVLADAANEANFSLAAGQLTVDPTEVEATVRMGQSAQRTFSITNTGTAPAELELGERLGGFEILSDSRGVTPGSGLVPNPDYDPNSPTTEGQYLEGTRPSAHPDAAGDVLASFPATGLALGWGVGFDGDVWLSDVPNNDTNTEFTVNGDLTGTSHSTSPWVGTWPGDMALLSDGEMCQVNVGGDNGIYCWNTGSGDVTRSITGSFAWTSISQRGLAYRPDDDTFYIGGWNQDTFYHVRGFSHANPGEVLNECVLGPATGISGLAWNPTVERLWVANNTPDDEIWLMEPDSCTVEDALPHPDPGFNGAGLHMDDAGNLWMVSQGQNTAYLIESGVPHSSDVSWLAHDPETATLQPGESVTVTVSVDSNAEDVAQPGAYTAGIGIQHDTPYQVPTVGVTMNVTPPNDWGKITGTVTGVACDGTEAPLAGATVQIDGAREDVTLSTDGDGGYAYWLPIRNNPLTLIAAVSGHQPQTRDAALIPRKTVVENFALSAVCLSGNQQFQ